MDAYGLIRYLVAATLVRTSDGGAATGLVLLAVDARGGARAGGLLAAGLTAPHLLGPWVARPLDRARDPRPVLAGAFLTYGAALAAGALLLGHAPLAVAALTVVLAGACGPLLTGGMSSTLAGVVGAGERAQRRAEGWDAVSYGVAGTAGPAVVAALAIVSTPLGAVLALAGAAAIAAAATSTLPRGRAAVSAREDAPPVADVLKRFVTHGPLRRVSSATLLTAVALGGLPVVGVVFGDALSERPGAGATLVAAFGLGNLAGSLLVTAFPLRGDPDALTSRHVAIMGAAVALCALAPSYPLALIAFALVGASNAPFFTATLAARSRYSSPQTRAQVFAGIAGGKMAMSALGTALAGLAVGAGPRAVIGAGAALVVAGAALATLDRRLSCLRTA